MKIMHNIMIKCILVIYLITNSNCENNLFYAKYKGRLPTLKLSLNLIYNEIVVYCVLSLFLSKLALISNYDIKGGHHWILTFNKFPL